VSASRVQVPLPRRGRCADHRREHRSVHGKRREQLERDDIGCNHESERKEVPGKKTHPPRSRLQTQLGHTDARLTLDVYTQPMPAAQKLLADKVARVLLPVAPKLEMTEQKLGGLLNMKGCEIKWRARRESNSRPFGS
jgi:hypothetical protein